MEKPQTHNFEQKIEREISPDAVREIERLELLDTGDRMHILLTCADLKPASWVGLEYKKSGNSDERNKELAELVLVFKRAGLIFKIDNAKPSKIPDCEEIGIFVSNTEQNLNSLTEAIGGGNNELIGMALGFPSTAREAYVGKRKRLNWEELPKETRESQSVAKLFCGFVLSEDNWQEEIQQGQRNADFMKKVSPYLYEKYLKEYDFFMEKINPLVIHKKVQ